MGYSAEAFRRALGALASLQEARGLSELHEAIGRGAQALDVLYFRIVEVWMNVATVERFEPLMDTAPAAMTLAALLARHVDYPALTFDLLAANEMVEPEAQNPNKFAALKRALRDEHAEIGARHWVLLPLSRGDQCGGFAAYFFGDKIEDRETLKPYLRLFSQSAFDHLRIAEGKPAPASECPLTKRQREALNQVALGKSDWEIAVLLGVSQSTVHEHIEAAKRRLGVRTRVQAVLAAYKNGWISD